MRKVFCDACGQDTSELHHSFSSPIHIVSKEDGGMLGYVARPHLNGAFHEVSGRDKQFDLCIPCFNNVHAAAYQVIQHTREGRT